MAVVVYSFEFLLKALMDLCYLNVTNTASNPFKRPARTMLFNKHFPLATCMQCNAMPQYFQK